MICIVIYSVLLIVVIFTHQYGRKKEYDSVIDLMIG